MFGVFDGHGAPRPCASYADHSCKLQSSCAMLQPWCLPQLSGSCTGMWRTAGGVFKRCSEELGASVLESVSASACMCAGGAEVARFCQKYMAGEIAKMQQYKDGNISDSLVNVFHKMDDMLRDTKYQEEVRRPDSGVSWLVVSLVRR